MTRASGNRVATSGEQRIDGRVAVLVTRTIWLLGLDTGPVELAEEYLVDQRTLQVSAESDEPRLCVREGQVARVVDLLNVGHERGLIQRRFLDDVGQERGEIRILTEAREHGDVRAPVDFQIGVVQPTGSGDALREPQINVPAGEHIEPPRSTHRDQRGNIRIHRPGRSKLRWVDEVPARG